MITITIASIFLLTLLAWMFRQATGLKICPFCAGVSGTWIWMLAAYYLGYSMDMDILAMLMGGSVVGTSYTLEKYKTQTLFARTLFIASGFIAAYALINSMWVWLIVSVVIAFLSVKSFFIKKSGLSARASELEAKMKNCC